VYLLRKVILKGPDDVPGGERRPDGAGAPLAPASATEV
jgi:cytochrome bd ubiquinol oxidase subunit I